jgi:hypothetical protein
MAAVAHRHPLPDSRQFEHTHEVAAGQGRTAPATRTGGLTSHTDPKTPVGSRCQTMPAALCGR